MPGTLYVAATPIGNLDDASERLRQVLADCDGILAEDTRRTVRLLGHLGIQGCLTSLHDHNEAQRLESTLERLAAGQNLVLVSDAGTPLISDPGFRLVAAARQAGIEVIPVPGPSAMAAAISVAGLPSDRFLFCGFLPAKPRARREALSKLARESATLVFYEASHRVGEMLSDCAEIFGPERPAFLGREMTKQYEQYRNAGLGALARAVADGEVPRKGEFVLVVQGSTVQADQSAVDLDDLLRALLDELPPSAAARVAARVTGHRRRDCFDRAEALKNTG